MTNSRRILCVDDHADTYVLIATILSQYEVVSALSKSEGLISPGNLPNFRVSTITDRSYLPTDKTARVGGEAKRRVDRIV